MAPAGAAFGLTATSTRLPAVAHIAGPAATNSETAPSNRESEPLPRPDPRAVALDHGLTTLDGLVAARRDACDALAELDAAIDTAVAHLRVDGATWVQIGAVLRISRQGARQRFGASASHTVVDPGH
ncbi:MAG: hypothetical protein KJ792_12180 [Actinobacteria bacterium]|nr:hypothetical protein [Actinomycetota bacterium]MCG2801896.1 hypothetical protein [Cellulomonas sp.]